MSHHGFVIQIEPMRGITVFFITGLHMAMISEEQAYWLIFFIINNPNDPVNQHIIQDLNISDSINTISEYFKPMPSFQGNKGSRQTASMINLTLWQVATLKIVAHQSPRSIKQHFLNTNQLVAGTNDDHPHQLLLQQLNELLKSQQAWFHGSLSALISIIVTLGFFYLLNSFSKPAEQMSQQDIIIFFGSFVGAVLVGTFLSFVYINHKINIDLNALKSDINKVHQRFMQLQEGLTITNVCHSVIVSRLNMLIAQMEQWLALSSSTINEKRHINSRGQLFMDCTKALLQEHLELLSNEFESSPHYAAMNTMMKQDEETLKNNPESIEFHNATSRFFKNKNTYKDDIARYKSKDRMSAAKWMAASYSLFSDNFNSLERLDLEKTHMENQLKNLLLQRDASSVKNNSWPTARIFIDHLPLLRDEHSGSPKNVREMASF